MATQTPMSCKAPRGTTGDWAEAELRLLTAGRLLSVPAPGEVASDIDKERSKN